MASPFTPEMERWIVCQAGAAEKPSVTSIQRSFRLKFNVAQTKVPKRMQFYRLINRFQKNNSTVPLSKRQDGAGVPKTQRTQENILKVAQIITDASGDKSVRKVARETGINRNTVHTILRKDLKFKAFKCHLTQPLTEAHIAERNRFCSWLLTKGPDFPKQTIFTDEKMWVDKRSPNRQNERRWALTNPFLEVACRTQSVKKRMCLGILIDGQCWIYWFPADIRLTSASYLDILQNWFWPRAHELVARKHLTWQQDGATSHTTEEVRDWLESKFGERTISRKMDRPWPARSPDLSPLDYFLWGAADQYIRETNPQTIEELMIDVSTYAESLDRAAIEKAVCDIIPRAQCCLSVGGGSFEARLKYFKRNSL